MNVRRSNLGKPRRGTHFVALFLLLCGSLATAKAKENKSHVSNAIKVVATMSFDDKPATDMQIREVNRKRYLFVQLANAQGVAVVDISKPNKPRIVSSMQGPAMTGETQLDIHGNVAVIIAKASEHDIQITGKGEFAFWDISDPANPRVVQQFADAVRVLQDDRGYTYVLNRNALSVVYQKQNPPTDDLLESSLYGG